MQHVVSATTGTTAIGRPRRLGTSSCSTEAKYEFRSRNSQRNRGSPSPARFGLLARVATHIDSASALSKPANGGKPNNFPYWEWLLNPVARRASQLPLPGGTLICAY